MSETKDQSSIGKNLLLQEQHAPSLHGKYRKEIEAMLESQSRAIRREKWTSVPIGIYLILFSTAFFLLAAFSKSFEQRLWFALCALFIALIWVPIVLRYHIIRFRLEMMKEIKETQWRIAEIADSLPGKK